jgi:aminopeptidase N
MHDRNKQITARRRVTIGLLLVAVLVYACLCLLASGGAVVLYAVRFRENPSSTPTPTATATVPSPTPTGTKTPTATSLPTSTLTLEGYAAGSSGIGDSYYPRMGNGGYDVQHYDLNIQVDLSLQRINAVAKIDALSLSGLLSFDLDLNDFDIGTVNVNGQPAGFDLGNGELVITPSTPIPPNTSFNVEISYSGKPGGITSRHPTDYLDGWNFYEGGVIVAGEPTGAETWFPSNNHPRDKATFTMNVTAAKPYVVAANGVLDGETDNGNGTETYRWIMDEPMATYLATVAIGNFDLVDDTPVNGIPMRSYLPHSIRGEVADIVSLIPEVISFYDSLFGPYPFDACGVVVHDLNLGFALENQTLVVVGSSFFDESILVHELSHQWFGDSISLSEWKDIWLNEGFASYAEILWKEHKEGLAAAEADVRLYYRGLSDRAKTETIRIGDPGPDRLFDIIVYRRGELVLHALRRKVGDDAFFRILHEYFLRFRDGNATTEDFISLAEEISNTDLESFFQAWLYEVPMPPIPEMGLPSD